MSLFFYGVCILGVVLGGLMLLVTFCLLAMAQKSDESLEELELEMLQAKKYGPPPIIRGKSENLCVPATSDLYHGGATRIRIFSRR
jgi:hypothetical protein